MSAAIRISQDIASSQPPPNANPLIAAIVGFLDTLSKKKKKPIIVGGNGGPYTEKMIKLIEKHNVPVYQDLRTWVAAASALAHWGKVLGK